MSKSSVRRRDARRACRRGGLVRLASCEKRTGEVEGMTHRPFRGIVSCRRRGACGRCESAQMMSLVWEVGPWCASKAQAVASGEIW